MSSPIRADEQVGVAVVTIAKHSKTNCKNTAGVSPHQVCIRGSITVLAGRYEFFL
jgi:hypothetical protein